MAMGIEYHQNRMPHMVSVLAAWASGSWCRLHRCLSPPEDATHGISIDCMGIGIEYHQNRTPHMVSVSTAWVYGSGMIHGAINCNNYKSDTSREHHTRHGYRFHRHLVHGIGCMSIEDAGHGISIGCMSIEDATHGIGIDCMGISSMGIWFMVSAA